MKLSSATRDAPLFCVVQEAYFRVELLNRMTRYRTDLHVSRWLAFHAEDDIAEAVAALVGALDNAVPALSRRTDEKST